MNFWNTDRTDLFKSLWEASELILRHVNENFQKHLSDMEAQAPKLSSADHAGEL